MTSRRAFVRHLSMALLLPARAASAQAPRRVARIGYLTTATLETPESRLLVGAFQRGLLEHGYVIGHDVLIEFRSADGQIERFPRLARELVALNPDVIIASNTPAARALQRATRTISIVAQVMGDPVGDGLVASLARPGGNITGLTFLGPELVPKRLELLKEALPAVSRVGGLWHPAGYGEVTTSDMVKRAEAAARALALQLRLVSVTGPQEITAAFATMARDGAGAVIIFPSPMLFNERRRIVDLAAQHRLPMMAMARQFVDLGGLLAYGANIPELARRSAAYVDKILKGARPGDLAIEQPTTFELVVNVKTASALGLTLPQSLLLRADEVIQ